MKVGFMGVNGQKVMVCICNQPVGQYGGIPMPYPALGIQ